MLPVMRRNGWAVQAAPWFERVFEDVERAMRESVGEAGIADAMPIAFWSDEGSFHLEADLPGARLEDIEATVHEGRLYLRCERKPEEGREYLYSSRRYGKLERVVNLPEAVDPSKVEASYRDGVLHLTLPKSAEARPFRISIHSSPQG